MHSHAWRVEDKWVWKWLFFETGILYIAWTHDI
jgi:hypothetical protein